MRQLEHESWLSIVEDALLTSGMPARYLNLEITESVIITHPDKAVATLMKLKKMGVSITVDNFGTGYSSLSYLVRLPIQANTIDLRFVRGPEQIKSDYLVTQAIIALSHSLIRTSSPKASRPSPSSSISGATDAKRHRAT